MKKQLSHMKKILADINTTIDALPSFEWCTRDKQIIRAHERINEHLNEQIASIDALESKHNLAKKVQIGLFSGEFIRGFSEDNYPGRKALETIQDCFEVLKRTGILEAG